MANDDELAAPVYYPVFLDLRGRRCLVVGGGAVARRKVDGLVAAGAAVTVVAPAAVPMPAGVTVCARPFAAGDLAGAVLVIAATDDARVNAEVAREAAARGVLVNVVDDPAACGVILPAVVRRGALQIAISTGGASPTLARRLRVSLEAAYGAEYGELVELLWRLRQRWEPRALAAGLPAAARREAWDRVLDLPLLDMIRAGDRDGARSAAEAVLVRAVPAPPAADC